MLSSIKACPLSGFYSHRCWFFSEKHFYTRVNDHISKRSMFCTVLICNIFKKGLWDVSCLRQNLGEVWRWWNHINAFKCGNMYKNKTIHRPWCTAISNFRMNISLTPTLSCFDLYKAYESEICRNLTTDHGSQWKAPISGQFHI